MRICILFLSTLLSHGFAQNHGDGTRALWDENLLKKRPTGRSSKTIKQPVYIGQASVVVAPPVPGRSMSVGVTVWSLRAARPAEGSQPRILVVEEDADGFVPERVESGSPLSPGQRVRLTIEAPTKGYLYVVNREEYEGGSLSEPYLIFPHFKVNEGFNRVSPGRTIEVPPRDNRPPYFRIRASGAGSGRKQTGELLYIILSPEPIPSIQPGYTAVQIPAEQFADWEKTWLIRTQQLELADGAGQVWTSQEKNATGPTAQPLTQTDPLPQTIHHIQRAFDRPVMFKHVLHIAK